MGTTPEPEEDDPLGGEAPLTVIMQLLTDKSEGRPVDEEKLQYAIALSACATLVGKGIDVDRAVEIVESTMAKGDIRVSYSKEDGLAIKFGEGVGDPEDA